MTIVSKFNGYCTRCNNPIAVGDRVNWTPGVKGVIHASTCPPPPATVYVSFDASKIKDFLLAAQTRGLRRPRVRFLAPDGRSEMLLYVSGSRSSVPGAMNVKVGDVWYGRICEDGSVHGRLRDAAFVAHLDKLASDPVKAAKEYGALSGSCSFCGRTLEDEGSVEVGYGPVCARHYGLPHTPKGTPALKPLILPSTSFPGACAGIA